MLAVVGRPASITAISFLGRGLSAGGDGRVSFGLFSSWASRTVEGDDWEGDGPAPCTSRVDLSQIR